MIRCFSTLGCPELSLDEVLALASRHQVAAVELRALGGTTELPKYLTQHYGTPEALAEKIRASPVKIAGLNAGLRLVDNTAADREALLEFAPWADALGARLRVFDGGRTGDDGELARAIETVRWWQETRRARGWKCDLMVETHDSLFTSAALQRFLAAVPGTAILWDSHHTWKKGGEDPLATWRALRDVPGGVVHIHIKDSISVPSARHPFTYVLPGAGEFPLRELLGELRAGDSSMGFSGPVSLEWEKMWHPYLPPIGEALVAAQANGW